MTYTMTKGERIARQKLMRHLHDLDYDYLDRELRVEVPDAWHTLEADLDVREPKVKVTLYLDVSVAKFFRAMGNGYQARINRLLSTWANMKITNLIETERKLRERFGILMEKEQAAMKAGIKTPGYGNEVKEP